MDRTYLEMDDKKKINLMTWEPSTPKGIVLIIHGMGEYIERYNEFAAFLLENNFAVFGHDHRGHGESIDEGFGFFKEKDGWNRVIKDIKNVYDHIISKYPKLPMFILGHSMGSFMTRAFIHRYKDLKITGVLISGTGNPSKWQTIAIHHLARLITRINGPYKESQFLHNISMGDFNDSFRDKNVKSWLTSDREKYEEFRAYEHYGKPMTASFYRDFFKGVYEVMEEDAYNVNFPLYIFSGSEDPVGSFGADHYEVIEKYSNYTQVDEKLYKGYRHEMLNEINRIEVYNNILNWITQQI